MFRRLSLRLTLLSVILLVVLYTITSVAVFTISQNVVMRGIDQQLLDAAQHVYFADAQTGIPDANATHSPTIAAIISDGSGRQINSIAGSTELRSGLIKAINPKVATEQFINHSFSGEHYRIFYLPLDAQNGGPHPYIATIIDDTSAISILARLREIIYVVGAFGLVGAATVGFILSERMLRPIRNAWKRQIEFVADASHELRTPLAVIQSNLGIVMEHTDEGVTENLEWLNNAHGESRRLSKLVQDLLTLARSDSERMPIERQPVDLRDLITHIGELYEAIIDMKELTLTTNAPEPIIIAGDRDRLHQLLVILLDNAVKFTPAGGAIAIALSRVRNTATLTVTDTGLGIAKDHLSRVFDRFFTVDPARSREQQHKGTGLGLSIAKWVVEAHGGRIGVSSNGLGQGTVVRIEFPHHVATTKGVYPATMMDDGLVPSARSLPEPSNTSEEND